jgi:cell division protein FtsB
MELSKDARDIVRAVLEEAGVGGISSETVSDLLYNPYAAVALAQSVVRTLQHKLEQSQEINGNQSSMIEDLHAQIETTEQEQIGLQQQIEQLNYDVSQSNEKIVRFFAIEKDRLNLINKMRDFIAGLVGDILVSPNSKDYVVELFDRHSGATTLAAERASAQMYKDIEQGRVSLDGVAASIEGLFDNIPHESAITAASRVIDFMTNVHREHTSVYILFVKLSGGNVISKVLEMSDDEAFRYNANKNDLIEFATNLCLNANIFIPDSCSVVDAKIETMSNLTKYGPWYVL